MRNNKTPQVAILIDTTNAWGRRIIQGILSYAKEVAPWNVYVHNCGVDSLGHMPSGWKGDAIIARVINQQLAQEIKSSGLPTVNVADIKVEGFEAPCVRVDDLKATQLAVQHFVERGFKNIGFVGPANKENPKQYLRNFEQALFEHDLRCDVFSTGDKINKKNLASWLFSLPKPTAILVWGNGYAKEVSTCCQENKISVPHDIAILSGGYDELISHSCFPSLSGIHAPLEQMGKKSAQLVHEMLTGKTVPNETVYLAPTKVIEHQSTETMAIEDPHMAEVIRFIKTNAFQPITVDDINNAVPMSRRALERKFSQVFGHSLGDEIRRIRVNKARGLLSDTDLPMQMIAEACGYATYNYLTSVFKKTTGKTPREYRNMYRAQKVITKQAS